MKHGCCAVLPIALVASMVAVASQMDQGTALLAEGRLQEAGRIFEDVLADSPDRPQARYMLGRVRFLTGDLDGAVKQVKHAVELDEKNVEYRLFLATLYGQKARRASILGAPLWAKRWLNELETSHRLEPANIEARQHLIQYYLHAPAIGGGDKKRATVLSKETIGLDEIQGRLLLAHAHRDSDRFDDSAAEYQKVIQIEPGNLAAHIGMGYVHQARGDLGAAEEWFKKGVEIAPENASSHESLGDHYVRRGMSAEAIRAYLKSLALNPKSGDVLYAVARLYEDLGRPKDAGARYAELLRETPHSIHADEARKRLDRLRD